MIFGSIINEDLKDEIVVTLIATGFIEQELDLSKLKERPVAPVTKSNQDTQRVSKREEQHQNKNNHQRSFHSSEDTLDIPTFLRNRNNGR